MHMMKFILTVGGLYMQVTFIGRIIKYCHMGPIFTLLSVFIKGWALGTVCSFLSVMLHRYRGSGLVVRSKIEGAIYQD